MFESSFNWGRGSALICFLNENKFGRWSVILQCRLPGVQTLNYCFIMCSAGYSGTDGKKFWYESCSFAIASVIHWCLQGKLFQTTSPVHPSLQGLWVGLGCSLLFCTTTKIQSNGKVLAWKWKFYRPVTTTVCQASLKLCVRPIIHRWEEHFTTSRHEDGTAL